MHLCKHPLIREFPEMVSTFAHIVQTLAKNYQQWNLLWLGYSTPQCMTRQSSKSRPTKAVKSTQCYLGCLPLVVLSISFTHPAASPSLCFIQTSTKHCRWTITDSAQMTSEIALFPLPCTHMSQMLFGWEWLHAKIKRNVPLAIELTAHGSALLPLFIFLSEGAQ